MSWLLRITTILYVNLRGNIPYFLILGNADAYGRASKAALERSVFRFQRSKFTPGQFQAIAHI